MCATHTGTMTQDMYTHTKHATKSPSYLTPTAKQTRTTKQQIMHAHGRRKQHSNKTRKTREQNRQLKQAKMPKKMCAKHNKQSPKILVTHMDAANTTSASEKAKY